MRQRKKLKPLPAPPITTTSRLPRHRKLLELLDHTRPTAAVVGARLRFLGKTAMGHSYVGAGGGGSEFPAYDGFLLGIEMPVGDPCIDEQARRIEFQYLTVTLELADTVNDKIAFLRGVAVAATEARIHVPEFHRAARVGEPAHELIGFSQRLEDTARRRRDLDLRDNRILVGRDRNFRHKYFLVPSN